MIGYHFTGDTLRDGRPIPPTGVWLQHIGDVVPCECGLHASACPFDAMQFAPGVMLHRVELVGDLTSHGKPVDKWVGKRRRIIESLDATDLLRTFARWCALQVIDQWEAPPIVREYVMTGRESLRAAAWAASRVAARDAAWDAAWFAARDAQRKQFCRNADEAFSAKREAADAAGKDE